MLTCTKISPYTASTCRCRCCSPPTRGSTSVCWTLRSNHQGFYNLQRTIRRRTANAVDHRRGLIGCPPDSRDAQHFAMTRFRLLSSATGIIVQYLLQMNSQGMEEATSLTVQKKEEKKSGKSNTIALG